MRRRRRRNRRLSRHHPHSLDKLRLRRPVKHSQANLLRLHSPAKRSLELNLVKQRSLSRRRKSKTLPSTTLT